VRNGKDHMKAVAPTSEREVRSAVASSDPVSAGYFAGAPGEPRDILDTSTSIERAERGARCTKGLATTRLLRVGYCLTHFCLPGKMRRYRNILCNSAAIVGEAQKAGDGNAPKTQENRSESAYDLGGLWGPDDNADCRPGRMRQAAQLPQKE